MNARIQKKALQCETTSSPMLFPLCCTTEFEVSPQLYSQPDSQLEACIHIKLIGTEYCKQIFRESTKSVNSFNITGQDS